MNNIFQARLYRRMLSLFALISVVLLSAAPLIINPANAADGINVWWPASGARIAGVQPFKAVVPGMDVAQYEMFWQVDGGSWNWMDSNYADYPHKEASVNLSGWTWRGSGPYAINFIARKNGIVLAQYPVTIYIDNGLPAVQSAQPTISTSPTISIDATVTPAVSTEDQTLLSRKIDRKAPSTAANPLSGFTLYVDPSSFAARQALAWQSSDPVSASRMQYLAAQPTAMWLGEWNWNVADDVRARMSGAGGTVPVFVTYAIPQRDCGGYSNGGTSASRYSSWIIAVASGIGNGNAVVILEPDALAQISCLSSADQSTRLALLAEAVTTLKRNAGTKVYIDAGHSDWIDATTMASRLAKANVARADGFALNVSNFMTTAAESAYGTAVSAKTNNKHFVIDTSRNGNGSNGEWCNPYGRAIGSRPTTATGNSLIDAYLWIKVPGESDGTCNGGPSAGTWWPSYAISLVEGARIAGL